eukprot:3053511-Rhodomonas_salina.1
MVMLRAQTTVPFPVCSYACAMLCSYACARICSYACVMLCPVPPPVWFYACDMLWSFGTARDSCTVGTGIGSCTCADITCGTELAYALMSRAGGLLCLERCLPPLGLRTVPLPVSYTHLRAHETEADL